MCARLLCAVLAGAAGTLHAQIPVQAPERFEEGIAAFEAEDYERSYDIFASVYVERPTHSRSAAALLMAGKSLYRLGRLQEARDFLSRMRHEWPGGVHVDEAEQVKAFADRRLRYREIVDDAFRLGIALPLSVADPTATQALFSGIYAAVMVYNRNSERRVQIVFRDTDRYADGARDAVNSLVAQDVDAIIGPLYSDDVAQVASLVNDAAIVTVAPMANAVDVTAGSRYIFQTNPTFEDRGRFIAREVTRRFEYGRLGVISEHTAGRNAELIKGFEYGARENGAEVVFHYRLESPSGWGRISTLVDPDTLRSLDALFLPVYDVNASQEGWKVRDALEDLAQMGDAPHILGTESWDDLELGTTVGQLRISFAEVFHVQRSKVGHRAFEHQFHNISNGRDPDRLAYVGFDVASFLLETLDSQGSVRAVSLRGGKFEGLGMRISFDAQRRNTALFFMDLTDRGGRLAR